MALFEEVVSIWIVVVEVSFDMLLTSLKNSSYSFRYGPNTTCCSINKSATLFLIATRFRHGKRQNWPNLVRQDFVDIFVSFSGIFFSWFFDICIPSYAQNTEIVSEPNYAEKYHQAQIELILEKYSQDQSIKHIGSLRN